MPFLISGEGGDLGFNYIGMSVMNVNFNFGFTNSQTKTGSKIFTVKENFSLIYRILCNERH